jgi:hypothetical protein
VPNFCPECGSSQATSRFCSSCGYSLASTPAPPDASTRVEDTPVFQPFAPPVVETWDSLAADPWSSTAGAVTPPPIRNVVTQTPVDVSERLARQADVLTSADKYLRLLTVRRLTLLKWLWRFHLVTASAYGALRYRSATSGKPAFGTDAPEYVLVLLLLVGLLTLSGVAASTARRIGAKTPHPVLAILLTISAGVVISLVVGLISPEYSAGTEITLLLEKGLDRRLLYGFALLLGSLVIYAATLAPAIALSKTLELKYPDSPLSAGDAYKADLVRIDWRLVLQAALIIGATDIVAAGLVFDISSASGITKVNDIPWGIIAIVPLTALGGLLRFYKPSPDTAAIEAAREAQAEREAEWKDSEVVAKADWLDFWRWCLYIVGSIGGMFLLLSLIAFIVRIFR